MPRLSIISVNYNNHVGLQKTMQTVLDQSFTDFEYIVIDGGSTDGSKEYIQMHARQLTYWVSESDQGIYDAMNKGITRATGDFLMFLNSGDYLLKQQVLQQAFEIINKQQADIYYAENIQIGEDSSTYIRTYPSILTLDFWRKDTINHQASFIKKDLFNELGFYDNNYSMAADYAFYLKAFIYGKTFGYLKLQLLFYRNDGISSINREVYLLQCKTIWENTVPALTEKLHVENNLYRALLQQRIMTIAWKLNKAYQSFRQSLK